MLQRSSFLSQDMRYDAEDPPGYQAGAVNASKALGASALAVKVFELPPGQRLCPYHYEYEEEWLVVLGGSVLVRTPDGEEALAAGDIVQFPAGPDGAHQVSNPGEETVRVIMFSSAREPAVAVYPDSDKIAVWPGNPDDKVMLRRADGGVDYWDGERG
jgi:uncharacterized cupin superfamily protein